MVEVCAKKRFWGPKTVFYSLQGLLLIDQNFHIYQSSVARGLTPIPRATTEKSNSTPFPIRVLPSAVAARTLLTINVIVEYSFFNYFTK